MKGLESIQKPILYYWGPCPTCAMSVEFAEKNGIELDKRDVEQQAPFDELTALGGDANQIPYLYDNGQLIQGVQAINEYLASTYVK